MSSDDQHRSILFIHLQNTFNVYRMEGLQIVTIVMKGNILNVSMVSALLGSVH